MAQLITGTWSIAKLDSHARGHTDIGLIFTFSRDQAKRINPMAMRSILFDCASELSASIALTHPELPLMVSVDDGTIFVEERVIGVVRSRSSPSHHHLRRYIPRSIQARQDRCRQWTPLRHQHQA